MRKLGRHIEAQNQIRLRKPHFIILQIVEPGKKFRLRRAFELAPLMDGVGRGIPVADNHAALVIKRLPAARKARVPVNGVKGRRGVGVDGVRVLSELARQIHLDQRGRRLVVLRKFDVLKPDALRFEPLARTRILGGFSRAVGSFKYNEFSHVF